MVCALYSIENGLSIKSVYTQKKCKFTSKGHKSKQLMSAITVQSLDPEDQRPQIRFLLILVKYFNYVYTYNYLL